jgi:hypothetical protein
MQTLPTHPYLERYLTTCTYCATSVTIRPVTGDELTLFLNQHRHPHCGPAVVITVRLVRRLAAAA